MAVILWLTTGSSRCQTPIPNVHGGEYSTVGQTASLSLHTKCIAILKCIAIPNGYGNVMEATI